MDSGHCVSGDSRGIEGQEVRGWGEGTLRPTEAISNGRDVTTVVTEEKVHHESGNSCWGLRHTDQ